MEKERRVKVLSLVALIVAVLGLTVAFAALSQTLTINGSANVDATTWDIHFENLSEAKLTGDAKSVSPTLSDDLITGYSAVVTKPGDSVTYEFDIVNNGTVTAEIYEIIIPQQEFNKCLAIGNAEGDCAVYDFNSDYRINFNDDKIYDKMINYGLYYEDGTTKVSAGDLLNAGDTKKLKLIVEYLSTADTLPSGSIKIASGDITINYVQSE